MFEKMFTAAMDVHNLAYAPYSGFKVSASILSSTLKIYSGINIENAAYPQSQCAEASAISSMILAGDNIIQEILIIGDGKLLCTPCGGCRQRLNEFRQGDVLVHVCGTEGLRKTFSLNELLPYSFGPSNLENL